MTNRRIKLLITDIDNTLYDWVSFYVPCFIAMVDEISKISGLERDAITSSFQRVFRAHRSTEYAFAIEELDEINALDSELAPRDRLKKYWSAVQAFRDCRRARLRLYPSVEDTLIAVRSRGILIVAHSDSMIVPVSRRLRQLNIDTLFDAICAVKDSGVPDYLPDEVARVASDDEVGARCRLIELPRGVRKPQKEALAPVLSAFSVRPDEVAYVGDSPTKDMALAAAVGVAGVWARYGRAVEKRLYDELLKITAWTPDEVAEEERAASGGPAPIVATIDRFDELLNVI